MSPHRPQLKTSALYYPSARDVDPSNYVTFCTRSKATGNIWGGYGEIEQHNIVFVSCPDLVILTRHHK